MTAAEFGASLGPDGRPGVTSQTIRNWIKLDRAGLTAVYEGGAWMITDPAKAMAWVRRNKAGVLEALATGNGPDQGGARDGAGRPKGGGGGKPGRRKPTGRPPGSAAWRNTTNHDDPADAGLIPPESPSPPSPQPLAPDPSSAEESRKTRAQVEKVLEEHRKLKLANDAREGQLIVVDEATRAWSAALVATKSALDALAADAADRVLIAAGLPAESRVLVLQAVDGAVARAKLSILAGFEAATPKKRGTAEQRNNETSEPPPTSPAPTLPDATDPVPAPGASADEQDPPQTRPDV